jgi:hypothetical protein
MPIMPEGPLCASGPHDQADDGAGDHAIQNGYADDAVIAFEDHLFGKRLLNVLGKRVDRYGPHLHPTKTRFVDFRFAQGSRCALLSTRRQTCAPRRRRAARQGSATTAQRAQSALARCGALEMPASQRGQSR